MSKLKVGDTVVLFRVGKIIAMHDNEPYPIEVEFEGGSGIPAFDVNGFTSTGKTFEGDTKPSLFTEEELQLRFIAKLARFKNPHGQWLTQSPKGMWFVHKTKPVVNGLGNAWFVDWADYLCVTEAPEDFSKQIFQLSDILTDDN